MQRTWYGGIASIVACVLLISLVMLTVLSWALTNMEENKSAIPRAVLVSSFQNTTGLQVHNQIRVHVKYYALLRPIEGIFQLEAACLKNPGGHHKGECASAVVEFGGIKDPKTHAKTTHYHIECHYEEEDHACVVDWTCKDCYVDEGPDGANISMRVSPAIAAPLMRVNVEVGSGVRRSTQSSWGSLHGSGGEHEFSMIETYVVPSDNNTLYSGFPASQFSFSLTPTFFETQHFSSLWSGVSEYDRKVGYHIKQSSHPHSGRLIKPKNFDRFFDVPIVVKFTVDSTPVLVRRYLTSTAVDLVNSILGSIAGLMAFIVVCVNFIDESGSNKHYEEEKTLLDDVSDTGSDKKSDHEEAGGEQELHQDVKALLDAPGKDGKNNTSSSRKRGYSMSVAMMNAQKFDHSAKFVEGGSLAQDPVAFEKLRCLLKSGLSMKVADAILNVSTGNPNLSPDPGSPPVNSLMMNNSNIYNNTNNNTNVRFESPKPPVPVQVGATTATAAAAASHLSNTQNINNNSYVPPQTAQTTANIIPQQQQQPHHQAAATIAPKPTTAPALPTPNSVRRDLNDFSDDDDVWGLAPSAAAKTSSVAVPTTTATTATTAVQQPATVLPPASSNLYVAPTSQQPPRLDAANSFAGPISNPFPLKHKSDFSDSDIDL